MTQEKYNGQGLEEYGDLQAFAASSEGSSQFAQPEFLRKLCSTPLLSRAEEKKWAKQCFDAQNYLRSIAADNLELMFLTFKRLAENADKVRLANYFEFEDDNDGDVRTVFMEIAPSILEEFGRKLSQHDSEEFIQALAPLRMRMLFFTECLELLEDKKKVHKGWKKLVSDVTEVKRKFHEAMNVLVERNLRLVMSIAWRYTSSGIPVADLMQEGNIGLMRSVERYDYRRGHCFSTYASYWIRQSILHLIMSHGRIIRMPVNTIRQLQKIKAVEEKYLGETGSFPDISVIAEETGLSSAKIRALQHMAMQPISLQSIATETATLEGILPDKGHSNPYESAKQESFRETIREILSQLNKREQQVIRMRFGLDGEASKKFTEIAEILGVSSERVRQIEQAALEKMRKPCTKRILEN